MELLVRNITVDVTAVSQVAIAENVNRVTCLFVNDSDTTTYLKLGETAVAAEGIRLNASGGSYEINAISPWLGAVYTIGGAVKRLMITEVYREP